MQPKKKSGLLKKNPQKKKSYKIQSDHADTINTTKQRTFATIQQTFQFQDHKASTRTTSQNTSMRDCLDKMQANKLSPFSSPGKSLSPQRKKVFSPIVVKQKQSNKVKKSIVGNAVNLQKKVKNLTSKQTKSSKQKIKNSQKAKAQFQNQIIKRIYKFQQLKEKKITQLSQQEMQGSIRKISKPILALAKKQSIPKPKKNKNEIIKEMHTKIKQKYRKQYPTLKTHQLKLLSAVVLIQRLWRQTKVKSIIGQFLSPRNNYINKDYNQTFGRASKYIDSPRQKNLLEIIQNQGITKTQKSFLSASPQSIYVCQQQNSLRIQMQSVGIQNNSSILITPQKSQINLKDLQVSDQLSDASSTAKAKQILKYIDLYREVTLKSKKDKKKKKASRPNAFNFPESLSQKCLLQNLYRKRMTNIQCLKEKGQDKQQLPLIFLPSKSIQKSKQQYISPKKPQVVELQQRFYTQAQDQQFNNQIKLQKQPIKPEQQTVGSIGHVASKIIQFLINQFSQEFQAFSTKKCLKKKKRLPGIPINDTSIKIYLSQFVNFINKYYNHHFEDAFNKISASCFLRIFRVMPEQDIFQPGQDNQQEDINFPVLPTQAFFQYQPIYEEKLFIIKQQDKKYSNFLSGLIKIHNKCLVDCFSEYIQKQRIQSILFPWDEVRKSKQPAQISRKIDKDMNNIVQGIQKRIVQISHTRLGRLHKKDSDLEQLNLLKSLKQDYKRQGKDWSVHQDLLEIRLELTQLITQELFNQIIQDLPSYKC